MTISLEEHVARAIAKVWTSENKSADIVQAGIMFMPSASAAIAAVREHAPDPAEAMRAEIDWLKSAGRKQGQQIADSVEIEIEERVEAMRAKCEATFEAEKKRVLATLETVVKQRDDAVEALADKERARVMWQDDAAGWQDEAATAAEAMRTKCEAHLRAEAQREGNDAAAYTLTRAADAIAALKGNGEG